MVDDQMKVILAVFLWATPELCAFAQSGFFLVVASKSPCAHLVQTVDFQQEYCITEDPIIKPTDFTVVGDLQYDLVHENQFFNLRFTKSGLETLTLICKNLPDKQLVLVVNGKAAGIYRNKSIQPVQLMPISGKANSKEIRWVYDNLKSLN
jgi:hypothetical protein